MGEVTFQPPDKAMLRPWVRASATAPWMPSNARSVNSSGRVGAPSGLPFPNQKRWETRQRSQQLLVHLWLRPPGGGKEAPPHRPTPPEGVAASGTVLRREWWMGSAILTSSSLLTYNPYFNFESKSGIWAIQIPQKIRFGTKKIPSRV